MRGGGRVKVMANRGRWGEVRSGEEKEGQDDS